MTYLSDLDPDDFSTNPTEGPSFNDILERRASRRSVLAGSMAAAAGFLTTDLVASPAAAHEGRSKRSLLGFTPIPLGFADEVVVPAGYTARPFIPWGTPLLGSYPAFRPGANTAAEQEQQVGMNHDGMHYFPAEARPAGSTGTRRSGLLVLNHEFTEEGYLQTGTATAPPKASWTLEMIRKSQAAHGVSVVEIERQGDVGRGAVSPEPSHHRQHPDVLLRTRCQTPPRPDDRRPPGRHPPGTLNNCSHGVTPWDTYLACEENFNGYFRVDSPGTYSAEQQALISRYGVGGDRNNWADP